MVHGTAEHMGQRWSAGSRRRVRERSQSAAAMRWNSPIRNTGKEGGTREGDVGGSIWIPHHGGGRTMAHATMVSVSRCGKRALGPVGKCRYHIPNRLGRPSTSASPESGDSFISSLQRSSIFVATRFLRRRHGAPRRLAGAGAERVTSSRSPSASEPCTRGTCVASVRAARRLRHRTCSPEPRELRPASQHTTQLRAPSSSRVQQVLLAWPPASALPPSVSNNSP